MSSRKLTPAEAQKEKEREEFERVKTLRRAILVLCHGQDSAVAGVAVQQVLIAIRRADSGLSYAGACQALSEQFATMAKEVEPS